MMNLKSLAAQAPFDFGEVFYMVDSDFRTLAQGWSQADRTGPLDLFLERNPGRVFRTPGNASEFGSDSAAIQAANDAMVDFRGDVMFWTPGSYLPATAVTIDVPDARWLGQQTSHPTLAHTTITAGVTNALDVGAAADRMEFANLKLVPFTAGNMMRVAAACNNGHVHDCLIDATGVATSGSTVPFAMNGAALHWTFEKFRYVTDDQQGAMITYVGTGADPGNFLMRNWEHYHIAAGAGALAVAMVDFQGTTAASTRALLYDGWGMALAGGTVTALAKKADNVTNTVDIVVARFWASKGYSTAAALVTTAGAAGEYNVMDCRLGQDSATAAAGITATSTIFTA